MISGLTVAVIVAWAVIIVSAPTVLRLLAELLRPADPEPEPTPGPRWEPMVEHPHRPGVWVRLPNLDDEDK